MTTDYRTLRSRCIYEHRESRSRFVAIALGADTAGSAIEEYGKIRKEYHDAAHIPYAYRLSPEGSVTRFSDDGEPSGTGGRPLLDALVKYSLTNSLIAVVRYFGGVKLGVGGLKRAFFTAADACLSQSELEVIHIRQVLGLEFDYKYVSQVMKLAEDMKAEIINNHSDEKCRLTVSVMLGGLGEFRKLLNSVTNGSCIVAEITS